MTSVIQEISVLVVGARDTILGITGGAVAYLLDYTKAKRSGDKEFKFIFSSMLVNMMLGAFIGYLVGSSINTDTSYRDAIIGLSGVTAYNILLLAQSNFAQWLKDRFTNK